jgi:ElaB/YqjD/DUF883 family membrane-anchored ribosome-binding protein
MPKNTQINEYEEINDIKSDLKSLKSNTVALTHHLKEDGAERIVDLEERAKETFGKISAEGQKKFKEVEVQVRENPTQALLIAFAGGMLASYLMRGRR